MKPPLGGFIGGLCLVKLRLTKHGITQLSLFEAQLCKAQLSEAQLSNAQLYLCKRSLHKYSQVQLSLVQLRPSALAIRCLAILAQLVLLCIAWTAGRPAYAMHSRLISAEITGQLDEMGLIKLILALDYQQYHLLSLFWLIF